MPSEEPQSPADQPEQAAQTAHPVQPEQQEQQSRPSQPEQSDPPPRFSIVIPVRNGAGYLVRCISSIAGQTFGTDRVEVVATDDASTDGSGVILSRLLSGFRHAAIVRNARPTGPGGARNYALRHATGEYVFFVDCDDYLPERSLELIDACISANGSPDVVLYPYTIYRDPSSPRPKGLTRQTASTVQEAAFSAVGPWTHVCKRGLVVPFPEDTLSEDTAWHFEQFDKFETMANVGGDEPCYVYDRSNATAITDTVEWAGDNSLTLEQLAFGDAAVKAGKNDRWISDVIRNLANMYDVRRRLSKTWVRDAWAQRFRAEVSNFMTGHFVH